jgi:hypothetical protein
MVVSGWKKSENFVGEQVLMAVTGVNVSLASDLPKYLLHFTIKGNDAVARDFTHPHSPPVGRVA